MCKYLDFAPLEQGVTVDCDIKEELADLVQVSPIKIVEEKSYRVSGMKSFLGVVGLPFGGNDDTHP